MEPYDFAVQQVVAAGELLLRARDNGFETMMKGGNPRDIVTSVDHEVNDFLISAIKSAFPTHRIYSEEGGGLEEGGDEEWVIDPIDGSANFSRGIPHFAVCLGLLKDGVPVVGAVYNPVTKELFSFKKGSGAFLNGKAITVSKVTDLKEASVFLHAGRNPTLWDWGGASYTKLLGAAKKTLNYGGSALDACFVAAGRIEANVYGRLSTMDIASAIGILLEAGGRVVGTDGTPVTLSKTPQTVFMTNTESMERVLRELL
ncbi:MAG: inositol monophosphatase family protein [Candidatus Paceibacterota bacterium]|jgi:myo-inositol-1(or 4)-monophosphatase